MLYHRLLSELISPSRPFDFAKFWTRVGLDPSETFPPAFLEQPSMQQLGTSWSSLDDLGVQLQRAIRTLGVSGVDEEMKVVYRRQPRRGEWHKKTEIGLPVSREDLEIHLAVEASLMQPTDGAASTSLATHLSQGLTPARGKRTVEELERDRHIQHCNGEETDGE
jgi:hypothetical protein